jgi:diketogulonate reductase-like aldo/keto reductase
MAQPAIGAQASRLAKDLTLSGSAATKIPKLIYGTAWKKEQTADLVHKALVAGFRAIDTAAQPKHYDEKGVAAGVRRAVADGVVKREDLYIQTKFTSPAGQNHITPYDLDAPLEDKVHQSIQSSLRNFTFADGQEPYLDSVVLHSPLDTHQETMAAWKVLESYTPHRVRNLGISNTTLPTLEALCDDAAVTVQPAVVQNRFHDQTGYETRLRAYCRERGIVFQSFWTLTANPRLARSEPVVKVARGAGVTGAPAYYALVLGLEGVTILDGTTNQEHMEDDLAGIEAVGQWAEADGKDEWEAALRAFKALIREP